MTNETRYLLVTLPDYNTDEADSIRESIEQYAKGFERDEAADTIRVGHAPQLWVLAVETPDLPRPSVTIHATEAGAVMYLRDWTEKLPAYVPDEEVADWLAEHSDVWATIERMDYPVASAYVR